MILPKIIYPSQPGIPTPPSVSSVAGGSFGARTYYFQVTYVMVYGESFPSIEFTFACPANQVPVVASPAVPPAPTVPVAWNVYAALVSGDEEQQNLGAIDMGTPWTMPVTGLISGVTPPSTFGATLSFLYPPRLVPYSSRKSLRHDTWSTYGMAQRVLERTDHFLKFQMDRIVPGADAAAWDAFLETALAGYAFDYYPDATVANYTTYALIDTERDIDYHAPSWWKVATLTFREEIPQLVPPIGVIMSPTGVQGRAVRFITPNAGNFSVLHGLGYNPYPSSTHGVGAPLMLSPGDVWFQTAIADSLYLYLVASAPGLSGYIEVW
jgi:hypothetical protein